MHEEMTKAKLLHEMRSARAEWDELMAEVGETRMTEPGAAGDWSVKDVIAHLTAYDRWFVTIFEAYFWGEMPPVDGTEEMDYETRNLFLHRQTQARPLADVLADSHQTFNRLIELLEAHTEEYLTQPQQLEGVPEPVLVWKMLEGECYEHYREHLPSIRAWLNDTKTN